MRHCIVVHSDRSKASQEALTELLAGIEEEGFKFSCNYCDINEKAPIAIDADILAKNAARESAFGCGIGIWKGLAALWLTSHNMSILYAEEPSLMRKLGLNAARALKKLPFIPFSE